MLIGAILFGYFLTVTQTPQKVTEFITGLGFSPIGALVLIMLMYLVLGCLMDAMAMVILTVPIIFPAVTALGFDPIWFGVIIVMTVELGLIHPPVGMNVFVIKTVVQDVSFSTIFYGRHPVRADGYLRPGDPDRLSDRHVAARPDVTKDAPMSLQQADALEIQVLVDNVTDTLSSTPVFRHARMAAAAAPGEAHQPAVHSAAPIMACRWSSPRMARPARAPCCSTAGRSITPSNETACGWASTSRRLRRRCSRTAIGTTPAACPAPST